MEHHQSASPGEKKQEINNTTTDHSKMDHGNMPMGMAGHDHHKMMIDDFKKRFYIVLILTVPIVRFCWCCNILKWLL